MSEAESASVQTDPRAPKRRGKIRKRHTVAKVVLVSVVVLAMVTGLGVVFLYRHFNGNLTELAVTDEQLGPRPDKIAATGPREPLNILVMGSDSRDGEGNNIDGLTGLRRAVGHHDPVPPLGGPGVGVRDQHPARLGGGPARLRQ